MNWRNYLFGVPCALLRFDDRRLRLIGIPILALLSQVSFHQIHSIPDLLMSLVVTIIYWYTSRSIILFFRGRLPSMQQYQKRMILQIAFIILANLILFGLVGLYLQHFRPTYYQNVDLSRAFFAPMAFTFTIVLIYESIYLLQEWKDAALYKETAEKEQVITQLKTFQNQTNPHFLFNSLNTLSSFIQDNPILAEKYVTKLAEVYRYMLNISDQELITLQEELDFLDDYFYLMKIRYGKNLSLQIQIKEENKSLHVIPLSLQALIENAIKHNTVSAEFPLGIIISIENNTLIVTNNLQPKQNRDSSKNGTGLNNIKNRYKLLTNQEPSFKAQDKTFVATLPLLQINQYSA